MAIVHSGAPAVTPVPHYDASVELIAGGVADASMVERASYASMTSPRGRGDDYDVVRNLSPDRDSSLAQTVTGGAVVRLVGGGWGNTSSTTELAAADGIAGESVNLADSGVGSFSRASNSFGEAAPEGQAYTYGPFKPANTPGEMAGARGVRTIDMSTGNTIGWQYETYDAAGNVRIVRPQLGTGPGAHYYYDANGNFTGTG